MARLVKTVEQGDFTAGEDLNFEAILNVDGAQYDNVNQSARQVWRNTTAGAISVTISTDKLFSPQQTGLTSKAYTVPANSNGFVIDPLENQWWAQQDTTTVFVDVSADGLQLAVVEPAS